MTATSTDLHGLGEGAAGTALVLVEQARRGIIRWDEAHRMITTITAAPIEASATAIGVFRAAPAVGYLLHRAARPGYTAALATLDDAIATATRTRLTAAQQHLRRGEPTTVGEYDPISGLTGLGVYQMIRHRDARLLPDIPHYLVALTRPLRIKGQTLPGWWCGDGPAGVPSPDHPNGHANFAMAHGISVIWQGHVKITDCVEFVTPGGELSGPRTPEADPKCKVAVSTLVRGRVSRPDRRAGR